MRILLPLLLLAPLAACSSTPKKVPIITRPVCGIVVILDDPAASALLVAHESEKLARKVLKLLAKEIDADSVKKLEGCSLDELIARVVAWLHLDRLSPEMVADARAFFGKLPGSIREDLLSMMGVDDFGVAPMEMKRKKLKTYAIICWAPGHKAKMKAINPTRTPDDLTFNLEPK